jgi:hypothetical protein
MDVTASPVSQKADMKYCLGKIFVSEFNGRLYDQISKSPFVALGRHRVISTSHRIFIHAPLFH